MEHATVMVKLYMEHAAIMANHDIAMAQIDAEQTRELAGRYPKNAGMRNKENCFLKPSEPDS